MSIVEKKRDANDLALLALFRSSDNEDMDLLVDHLTDNGKGRISLSADACAVLMEGRRSGNYSRLVLDTIISELRQFGGNSIINLFRGGEGVSYAEVVRDVASHFKASVNKKDSVEMLENRILEKLAEQAWNKMSEDERMEFSTSLGLIHTGPLGPAALMAIIAAIRAGGFAAYRMALIAANSLARAMLGKGLTFATNATLTRSIAILAGPIGWAVTALWTVFDLASPAYRVTVPCIVQIAYMRQKQSIETCASCNTANLKTAKFCSECGAALQDEVAS